MDILNLYASRNGQTEKVARTIELTATEAGHAVTTINIKTDRDLVDLLQYDLSFIGSGVYTWLPDKSVMTWIDAQLGHGRKNSLIAPNSPRIPGKHACVYCTYAGPHTGVAEAVPALKYMGQLFDHLGISVADEWAIPGAFVPKAMQYLNTEGRLGNIEGRPNEADLMQIREKVTKLATALAPTVVSS